MRQTEKLSLGNLNYMYCPISQHEQVLEFARQLQEIRSHVVGDLVNLGSIYASMGELDQAVDHWRRALTIARECGDKPGEGRALLYLGVTYGRVGKSQVRHDLFHSCKRHFYRPQPSGYGYAAGSGDR